MSRTSSTLVSLCVVINVLSGCSNGPDLRTVSQASAITVYEGLPHQGYEGKLLNSEKKRKPTTDRHGFPFYKETLSLKPEDLEKLKAILGDPKSFKQYGGEKKCGGFHPDFAVSWSDKGRQNEWLICFGCGEGRLYGASGSTYYDISDTIRTQLKDILARYRQNRPVHYAWGLWTPPYDEAKIVTSEGVGKYAIGKSKVTEILGKETSESRERFANQGLTFQFDKRETLTGITVTSDEYAIDGRLIVGMNAEQIRDHLGARNSSKLNVRKGTNSLTVDGLIYDDFTFVLNEDQVVTAIIVSGPAPKKSN